MEIQRYTTAKMVLHSMIKTPLKYFIAFMLGIAVAFTFKPEYYSENKAKTEAIHVYKNEKCIQLPGVRYKF